MVARTSVEPNARWHLIPADSKRYARVAVIEAVIAEIEEGMRRVGQEPPPPLDWSRRAGACGARLGRIRRPAAMMMAAPASATKIA